MILYNQIIKLENELKDLKNKIKEKEQLQEQILLRKEALKKIKDHVLFPFYQGQIICQPLEMTSNNQNSKVWALSTMAMILVDYYDQLTIKNFRPYFPPPNRPTEYRRFALLARDEYKIIEEVNGINSRVVLTERGENLKQQLIKLLKLEGRK
tara:strand:+ start:326 stop:784 length:459 start_codon:yes stop_codon:yes gene_type:complete